MKDLSLYLWMLILLAFIATDIWQFYVLLANHISPESLFMKWINAVAYAMVCGVMMLVVASIRLRLFIPASTASSFAVTIGLMLWRAILYLRYHQAQQHFSVWICLQVLDH